MEKKKRFITMPDGTRVPNPEDLFDPDPIREEKRIAQTKDGNQTEAPPQPETPRTREERLEDAYDLLRPDRKGAAERRGEGVEFVDAEEASTTGGGAVAEGVGGGGDMQTVLRELVNATNLNTTLLQQIADSLDDGVKMTF